MGCGAGGGRRKEGDEWKEGDMDGGREREREGRGKEGWKEGRRPTEGCQEKKGRQSKITSVIFTFTFSSVNSVSEVKNKTCNIKKPTKQPKHFIKQHLLLICFCLICTCSLTCVSMGELAGGETFLWQYNVSLKVF